MTIQTLVAGSSFSAYSLSGELHVEGTGTHSGSIRFIDLPSPSLLELSGTMAGSIVVGQFT